jgi:hypothetical protein
MREFTTPSFPIYMYDGEGNYTVKTMGEVNPPSSNPRDFTILTCLLISYFLIHLDRLICQSKPDLVLYAIPSRYHVRCGRSKTKDLAILPCHLGHFIVGDVMNTHTSHQRLSLKITAFAECVSLVLTCFIKKVVIGLPGAHGSPKPRQDTSGSRGNSSNCILDDLSARRAMVYIHVDSGRWDRDRSRYVRVDKGNLNRRGCCGILKGAPA